MRLKFTFAMLGAVAGALFASAAAMADWHSPYIHRESDGSWTNVHYDDGVCSYYYAHNSYDNHTKLNKYGDCSRIAIGPDGMAQPIVMVPVPYGEEDVTVGSGGLR